MSRWKLIHDPEIDKADTGLRFTDVLFGFVIKELFTRLSDWNSLSGTTLAHLIAGSVLVLGSYIGFRKSLHRQNYKLFFFNLPLVRFILDQGLVVLYFRFATVTGNQQMSNAVLVRTDLDLLMLIFLLYVLWDCVSWWMFATKYRDEKGSVLVYDRLRLVISLAVFLVFVAMRVADHLYDLAEGWAVWIEVAAIGVLVVYRGFKDARA